ncbi:hypothetical protein GYMLUDRAFT_110215, partial [Collybiopsis luxurians FD-317 M1]
VTGGASGSLRKEFCELELLDDIMRLRYKGALDASVQGTTRSLLIESFHKWKGQDYIPENIHTAIRWSDKDPYLDEAFSDLPWSIVDKSEFNKSKKKSNSQNVALLSSSTDNATALTGMKCKQPDSESCKSAVKTSKKQKISTSGLLTPPSSQPGK